MIPRAIVHRLDMGTTGLMVVAKTRPAERSLSTMLRSSDRGDSTSSSAGPKLRKVYATLLLGRPKGASGSAHISIDAPIGRDPQDSRRMAVVADGKNASS